MDRMLYIGMNGAMQTVQSQAATANNLANASTTGFKTDLAQFRSMPVYGQGLPSRVFNMVERAATDMSTGNIQSTGRDLDMAVMERDGWFAVQAPDGGEAYTKAGDMRIEPTGMLVTGTGLPVMGSGGTPIVLPQAEKVEVLGDGTISVRALGQAPNALAQVDRIKMVRLNSEDLVKGRDGLIRLASGEVADADGTLNLVSGSLEGSNVNVVDEMVNMITLARQYELQVRVMNTAKENDGATTQMMRLG